jgi:hypothetical protein
MARKSREWYTSSTDRKRGILNKRERNYLLTNGVRSEGAYTPDDAETIEPGSAKERQIRQQIRNHTMNAMLDFAFLVAQMEDRDKRRVFNDGFDPERPNDVGEGKKKSHFEVQRELPTLIAFVYQLYQLEGGNVASDSLAEAVRRGIETVHHTNGRSVTADVEITIETGDEVAEIADRYHDQGPVAITDKEAFLLYEYEEIDTSEYVEFVHDHGD